MQENIKQGKTDLLTYQQAIGGSILQSIGGVVGDDDYDEEEEMPEPAKSPVSTSGMSIMTDVKT